MSHQMVIQHPTYLPELQGLVVGRKGGQCQPQLAEQNQVHSMPAKLNTTMYSVPKFGCMTQDFRGDSSAFLLKALASTQAASSGVSQHRHSLVRGQVLNKSHVFAGASFTNVKCPMCGNAEAVKLHYAENYMLAISIIAGCHLSAQSSH